MTKESRVLYNFDPTHLVTTPPKDGLYEEPLTKEYVVKHVRELSDSGVDTFMCCPNMLRRKLWDSKYDPHWSIEAPYIQPPKNSYAWEWDDKAYFRMREYILGGGNPIAELYEATRKEGLNFFFTYRMNDCHYLEKPASHIHDTFWKEHPEYRIKDYGGVHPNMHPQLVNLLQNYMYPEIREHYLNVLTELVQMYDIDGLELDFMRKPCLVPLPDVEKGRSIITDFIKQVRNMLNHFGTERGKKLKLGVRIPHSLKDCYDLAMDVAEWDRQELIDMVNTSTSYLNNIFALRIESFTSILRYAKVYGEMHYSLAYGKRWPNYGRRFIRNTTKEQYETGAFYLTHRGAYGVSLFNFVGSRQHEFNDPRGATYPGAEPPLAALKNLQNMQYLENCPKHYVINRFIVDGREYPDCAVPAKDDFTFILHLYEKNIGKHYSRAALRIETETPNRHLPVGAYINGLQLKEYVGTGEFFTPVSIEGLPVLENVRFFEIPIEALVTGENQLEVHNLQKTHPKEFLTFTCVELALYPFIGE
jgi:hypothetical protein